jgi:hypothetical protein
VDSEKLVEAQDLVYSDMNGTDKLSKLWYVPHITEALLVSDPILES